MPFPLLGVGASLLLKRSPVGRVLKLVPFQGWLVLGLAAVIGMHLLQDRRTANRLKGEIAAIAQQRDDERGAKLEFQAALADVTANRDALAGEIRRQNDAIGRLQLETRQAEQAAAVVALRALQAGSAVAAELRAPTTSVSPGHASMNDWLARRFGGQP